MKKKNPTTPHIRKIRESPLYSCNGVVGTTIPQAYRTWNNVQKLMRFGHAL